MPTTPSNVLELPPSETWSAAQVLAHAARQRLENVVVLGWDQGGDLVVYASRMSRSEALWLLVQAQQHALEG